MLTTTAAARRLLLHSPNPRLPRVHLRRATSTSKPKFRPVTGPWTVAYIHSLEQLYSNAIHTNISSSEAQAVAALLARASNDIVPAITRVVIRNLYVRALRELYGDDEGVLEQGGEQDQSGRVVCTGLDVLMAIKYCRGQRLKRTLEDGFETLWGFPAAEWGSVEAERRGRVISDFTDAELDVVSRGAYSRAFE